MAKIFKFTGYFIDPNGDLDADDVKVELEERTVDAIVHHVKVEEVYLGEWDDDHPLNACNCPLAECEKYFGRPCHD